MKIKKRKRKDSGDSTPSSTESSGSSSQSEERRRSKDEVPNASTAGQEADSSWESRNARRQVHEQENKREKTRRETKRVRTVSPELGLLGIDQVQEEGKGRKELLDDNFKIDSFHDQLQTRILLLEGRLKRYDDDVDKRVKKLERRMSWNEQEMEKISPLYKRSDVREEEEEEKDGEEDEDDMDDDPDEDEDNDGKLEDNDKGNSDDDSDDCNNTSDDSQNLPSLPADHPTTSEKHPPSTIPLDYGVVETPGDGWHPGFSSDTILVNSDPVKNDQVDVKDPIQEPPQQRELQHEHYPNTSTPENDEGTPEERSSEVVATELVDTIMNDDAPEGEEVREGIRRSETLEGAAKYVTAPGSA